ncbi:MAG TPA: protein phosphatase 2C domain-containing protein [Anaerolineales bacterium]|nr:protein phosphatase 2C domain-containing protein [Anaerolineales bacterium]
MAEIILGFDSNPGGRKYNEDRGGTDSFVTRGGLKLSVAVVCDGVGGEERGERAAQLAIDTFLAFLRDSDLTEPPRLLNAAVKAANLSAFNEAQRLNAGERMACTMVAAVIVNDDVLYISNVGDSRIYLIRDGQLTQLTRDHTFANVMVWMGKLSAQAAAANPDASKVMRVLGTRPDIQVDLGLYTTTTEYGEANRIGRAGLKLKQGDSVMVCSDGLVKDTATTGQPLVMPKEIVHILNTDEGPKAARAIMSIALGRIPVGEQVDNITLAIAQTEDPNRAANAAKTQKLREQKQQKELRRKMVWIAAIVAVPLCIALIALGAFTLWGINRLQGDIGGTSTQLAQATVNSLAQTQTVAAFTPTPTTPPPTNTPVPTQVPTLAAGEIAKLFNGEELLKTILDNGELITVPGDASQYLAVKHDDSLPEPGNIHLAGSTQLTFVSVGDSIFRFEVDNGSDTFAQTGPYPNGAEFRFAGVSIAASVRGCMAVRYYAENFIPFVSLACFSGECGYTPVRGGATIPLQTGQQFIVNINDPANPAEQGIPQAEKLKYWSLLNLTSAGRADARRCNVPPPPTPTPRPTATPTVNAAATAECERLQQLGTPCP